MTAHSLQYYANTSDVLELRSRIQRLPRVSSWLRAFVVWRDPVRRMIGLLWNTHRLWWPAPGIRGVLI